MHHHVRYRLSVILKAVAALCLPQLFFPHPMLTFTLSCTCYLKRSKPHFSNTRFPYRSPERPTIWQSGRGRQDTTSSMAELGKPIWNRATFATNAFQHDQLYIGEKMDMNYSESKSQPMSCRCRLVGYAEYLRVLCGNIWKENQRSKSLCCTGIILDQAQDSWLSIMVVAIQRKDCPSSSTYRGTNGALVNDGFLSTTCIRMLHNSSSDIGSTSIFPWSNTGSIFARNRTETVCNPHRVRCETSDS